MLSNTRSSKASDDDRLDAVFRALSDRTRRALLARLSRGPALVGELAAPFDMSLPAISRHIRVLEDAKLLARTVDGRVHRCALAIAPLQDADRWLDQYRTFWSETLDALERHVARDSKRR
jgi:DNA-binding transcriptional ArsR family regulator